MSRAAAIHDLSKARRKRFGPQLPPNHEDARLLLRVLRDFAGAALTLLDLEVHDIDAWARREWSELSPDARAAVDVLGATEVTAYRDALDAVEEEIQCLMEDAPAPRPE